MKKKQPVVERTEKHLFCVDQNNIVSVCSMPDGRKIFEMKIDDLSIVKSALAFFEKQIQLKRQVHEGEGRKQK